MLGVIKNVAKCCVILVGMLLITICAYAQEPVWEWAVNAGGTDDDIGNAIVSDNEGNTYTIGYFENNAIFGVDSLVSNGSRDIFVAKLDSEGNWQWVSQAGGQNNDEGFAITINDDGNIYVTGYFKGTAEFGIHSITSTGFSDIFVAKLDADGSWVWATQAGGIDFDSGLSIDIDHLGNCCLTGYFWGYADFGSHSLYGGGTYVAKIDENGNWVWAKQADGCYIDIGYGLSTDLFGNSYITGYFEEAVSFGSDSLICNGWRDIFIAKIDNNGDWIWAKQAGGIRYDTGLGIVTDNELNLYLTGYFMNTVSFGLDTLISNGDYDIFTAKIDELGNWLWAVQAGGNSDELGCDISVDECENCFFTGYFSDIAEFGEYYTTSTGGLDIFVAKVDSIGTWQWVSQAGGLYQDVGQGITTGNNGSCFTTGYFEGTATFGSNTIISNDSKDIFIAKLNPPVSTDPEINPDMFNLSNSPNPFNRSTIIHYTLKQEELVSLEIYNLKGQLLQTLLKDNIQAGDHTLEWNCQNIPAGVYFLKMKTDNDESVRKLILLR